jgi:hypothetical protein
VWKRRRKILRKVGWRALPKLARDLPQRGVLVHDLDVVLPQWRVAQHQGFEAGTVFRSEAAIEQAIAQLVELYERVR